MPANKANTGRWKKGESGNPSGRPKVPQAFKELVQEKTLPALQKIIDLMSNPKSKPADVFAAAKLIIEYGVGKPQDNLNLTHHMGDFEIVIGAPGASQDTPG